jgi:hypothetical protein
MRLFGFTQRPPGINDGMIRSAAGEPYQWVGGWLFTFAVFIYGLNALLMLVMFFFRAWRPFDWGLLFMVLLAPILGVVGFIAITVARHAH